MPSFPDLSRHDAGPADDALAPSPAGPVAPEDVLARVKAEGLRRRSRRHRRNAILAALGIAALAVPAVALLPGGGDDEQVTIASEGEGEGEGEGEDGGEGGVPVRPSTTLGPATTAVPTTVVGPGPFTTAVPAPDPDPGETAATAPPPPPAPATTAVQAPSCRNSTDPACGPFRWDPEPAADQPLTAAFVDVPTTIVAGEPTTFFVAWSDPDATLAYDMFSADGTLLAQPCQVERRHGPWTPPAPAGGSGELSYTHTFEAPGTYVVDVALATGPCDSPYNSQAQVSLEVTVLPAA